MLALLTDIGSTYTKLCAVNLDEAVLLGTSAVLTTHADVAVGVKQAKAKLQKQLSIKLEEFTVRRATSSAAGGLRLVAVGLVPELTGEAARMAALGAGAKVEKVYGYRLTGKDLQEIRDSEPDMILLVGGTDGGDRQNLLDNASALASQHLNTAVIIAGNKEVAEEAKQILQAVGTFCVVADNVLPRLGCVEVESARQAMREVFLQLIVRAKGLDKLRSADVEVVMPTPAAVLRALELLASDVGDIMAVDLGGATTDVYSLASGLPIDDIFVPTGLRPPYAYRTVEADIGMRSSALTAVAGGEHLLYQLAPNEWSAGDWRQWAAALADPSWSASNKKEQQREALLARLCVQQAVNRHVGSLEMLATQQGRVYLLRGKDLRHVQKVIGIGGALRHSSQVRYILAGALQQPQEATYMKPKRASFFLDNDYVFFAAGLLASSHPQCALQLMQSSLVRLPE